MSTEQDQTKPVKDIFPGTFLSFTQAKLQETLQRLMAVYDLPEPAIEAVDSLIVLGLMMCTNPDTWHGNGREGYETELQQLIQNIAWTVDELDNIQSRRMERNYDEIKLSGNPALELDFGWRD